MRYPKGLSVVPTNSATVARLYNTNIVIINHKTNVITLNSGGWNTKHTKKCINLVCNKLGLYLYQEKFEWFVSYQDNVIPFQDEMNITI